ncbi:hypothetical protein BJ508DRAFT_363336 [Ascobolus immersus RN42]|uniref:Uncharacterized protein n=1 Tax=Ascobolus immersus RN42 TaxID=1160509 RepID=A0A3N4IBM8_ASCIM|nr:hypothetical protein BJ508DRAFT_363336 [Ascobolus immersus RN42]
MLATMDQVEAVLSQLPPPVGSMVIYLLHTALNAKDHPLVQEFFNFLFEPFTSTPIDPIRILTTLGIIWLSFTIMGMATRWVMWFTRMLMFVVVLIAVLVAVVGGKDAVDGFVGVAKQWLVGHQSQKADL